MKQEVTKKNNMTYDEFYKLHRPQVHEALYGDTAPSGMNESLGRGAQVKKVIDQMWEDFK